VFSLCKLIVLQERYAKKLCSSSIEQGASNLMLMILHQVDIGLSEDVRPREAQAIAHRGVTKLVSTGEQVASNPVLGSTSNSDSCLLLYSENIMAKLNDVVSFHFFVL
jgi:hypothetical protein